MKKLFLFFALAFAPLPLLAQNVRVSIPFPSISSQYSPLLQANIAPNLPVLAVCNYPANQVPCTNYATTYNSAGTACANGAQDTPDPQPSSCQATGDAQGNLGFWIRAGTYDYTVCLQNTVTCLGPYTISVTGGAGSIVFQTNGVNNGNQGKQNLHSSDSSITLTDDGAGNINLQSATGVPSLPFFWSDGEINVPASDTDSFTVNGGTDDSVRGIPLYLPAPCVVNKIIFTQANSDSADINVSFGIYDKNKNLLLDSGSIAFASGNGNPTTVTLSNSVTIPAGLIYFVQSGKSSSGSASVNGWAARYTPASSVIPKMFIAPAATNEFIAANSRSGGALPASLGALSAWTSGIGITAVMFSN